MRSHDYPIRTSAQLLVDALRIQGVDTIFCVPGESYLSVLDALRDARDDIRLIVCRHEGAAANMAEAYGKLTGTPGVIANGAGNYTTWIHRFYQYRTFRTQLAPTSGAMGYGLPAAIAAKLRYPGRVVVAFAGDGCFLMYGQELATAMKYCLPVIILVVNNSMYGTIRMHQERNYPGKVYGTDLVNPNFAEFAQSFGAQGKIVDRTEEFPAAFEEALTAETPSLLELRVDPDVITPSARLSEIARPSKA